MKKRLLVVVLALLFIVQAVPPAYAAGSMTVYVTSPSDPNGNGTEGRPYNNINDALDAVADGGVIELKGTASFESTDDYSMTSTLPPKNITINGNGNRLGFDAGIVMGGNLTMNGVELYFRGPSPTTGIDRRIYANGFDLRIDGCTIGNQGSGTIDDVRGMVILAGGIKKDIDLGGRTQNISINSGRVSGVYIGGESGGGIAGKIIGNVNVSLSSNAVELSPSVSFPLAGVFASGLNSGEKLVNPQLGLPQEGVLSLSISAMTTGFQKYSGNGSSKLSLTDYGLSWQTPILTGFSGLTLDRTSLETSAAGVKNVTLNGGGNLRLPGSAAFETLAGTGGALYLSAGREVALTQGFTGETVLKIEGAPAALNQTVTYLTAPENEPGTLTYTDKSDTTELQASVEGGKRLWQIKGVAPTLKEMEVQLAFKRIPLEPDKLVIELPEGQLPTGSGASFTITVKCKNASGGLIGTLPLKVKLSDNRYADVLRTDEKEGPISFYLSEKSDALIPAGEMTITGIADAGSAVYTQSITVKMIVKPTLDFKIEQTEGKNYLLATLKGADNFAGKLTVLTVAEDYSASRDISTGTTARIPLSGLEAGEKEVSVTFTPTDTTYYRSVTEPKTVTIIEEIPDPIVPKAPAGAPVYTKITAGGKTLLAANLSGSFTDPEDTNIPVPGTLTWVDAQGNPLPDATPVTQGTGYIWRFTPDDTLRYTARTASVVLWEAAAPAPDPAPDGGGGGGGGGSAVPPPPKESPNPTEVTVTLPDGKDKLEVVIPTKEEPTASTVAVLIRPDGTRQVVKGSVRGKDGVRFTATENGTYTLTENIKIFTDVLPGQWYKEAIDYVSARELFTGVGDGSAAAPLGDMTRGMLLTTLYRYEGASVQSGESAWYADARLWALNEGLSDGTDMDGVITREQLATILYRYAGEPTVAYDLGAFPDSARVSAFALDAVQWAVKQGLLSGKSGGMLEPQARATRAEVATVLMRVIQN